MLLLEEKEVEEKGDEPVDNKQRCVKNHQGKESEGAKPVVTGRQARTALLRWP